MKVSPRRIVIATGFFVALLWWFYPRTQLPRLNLKHESKPIPGHSGGGNKGGSISEKSSRPRKPKHSQNNHKNESPLEPPEIKKVELEIPMGDMTPSMVNNIFYGDTIIGKYQEKERTETLSTQEGGRENATFFSLVRNSDFQGILKSIESVENSFNNVYKYDWVFANDEPFEEGFKKVVSNLVSGQCHFVNIPREYWTYPEWIDGEKAERTRRYMKKKKIKYGASESYRHMCRFNSGFFFKLPVMNQYKYYWRVEPDIAFNCDIYETDWFKYMRENNKKYAFVLSPLELHTTVRHIWRTTKGFMQEYPRFVHQNNSLSFLTDDNGDNYNMCHFWSNFEIGDLDFYRSEEYQKLFDYFDRVGGFYYSRWGDAAIHSIAVTMLLSSEEVFYLEDSGYFHSPNGDCPRDKTIRRKKRCACSERADHSWGKGSCIPKWYEINGWKVKNGVDFKNQHKFIKGQDEDEFDDW